MSPEIISSSSVASNTCQYTLDYSQSSATIATTKSDVATTLKIFQGFIIAIGVIGIIANGLICFLLLQMEWKKRRSTNLLILNQLFLDLFSCLFILDANLRS